MILLYVLIASTQLVELTMMNLSNVAPHMSLYDGKECSDSVDDVGYVGALNLTCDGTPCMVNKKNDQNTQNSDILM